MADKTILKSMRLSSDVYSYIESQPGDNFSDKFNRMVEEIRFGEESRRQNLIFLDKEIAACSATLQALSADEAVFSRISRDAKYLMESFHALTKRVDPSRKEVD